MDYSASMISAVLATLLAIHQELYSQLRFKGLLPANNGHTAQTKTATRRSPQIK